MVYLGTKKTTLFMVENIQIFINNQIYFKTKQSAVRRNFQTNDLYGVCENDPEVRCFSISMMNTTYIIILLLSLLPTGSHGASPKAHFSCLSKYLLSLRVESRASSDISGLGVSE